MAKTYIWIDRLEEAKAKWINSIKEDSLMNMKLEKATINDIDALVEMRLEYLLEDYGAIKCSLICI